MRIVTGALHRDFSRDNYWTSVGLVSENSKQETNILLCASYEYLTENLKTDDLNDKIVNDWVATTIAEIQKQGNSLFEEVNHFEVRAVTPDGYENGISFLQEKLATAA